MSQYPSDRLSSQLGLDNSQRPNAPLRVIIDKRNISTPISDVQRGQYPTDFFEIEESGRGFAPLHMIIEEDNTEFGVVKIGGPNTSIQEVVDCIAENTTNPPTATFPKIVLLGPGTYTGNITLSDYITLKAYMPDTVTINGNITLTSKSDVKDIQLASGYEFINKIHITGGDADLTNYVLPINLHYGDKPDWFEKTDIFLSKRSRTNFSDVYFTLSDETKLNQYIAGVGNFEVLSDSRLGNNTIIVEQDFPNANLSKGDLVLSGVPGDETAYGIWVSKNNGATWDKRGSNRGGQLLYIDSRGYIYDSNSGISRSTDGGYTWTIVKNQSNPSTLWFHMDEDSHGTLYCGSYALSDPKFPAYIYKSTDEGANWTTAYTGSGASGTEHIHALQVDPYTDNVYAGIGDTVTKIIRYVKTTDTWETVYTGLGGDATGWAFTKNYIYFACGDSNSTAMSVARFNREDDTWTPETVLKTKGICQILYNVDEVIYAAVMATGGYPYSCIFRSADEGKSWTLVYKGPYTSDEYFVQGTPEYKDYAIGFKFTHNVANPTGDDKQLVLGAYTTLMDDHRLYFGGEDHYQGTVFVNIPTVPTTGTDIYLHCGNPLATTTLNDATIFQTTDLDTDDNLVARWTFNETIIPIVGSFNEIKELNGTAQDTFTDDASSVHAGPWLPFIPRGSKAYVSYPNDANNGTQILINIDYDNDIFDLTESFTLMAWVKTSITNADLPIITRGRGDGSPTQYCMKISNRNFGISGDNNFVFSNRYIADGLWHQVGIIFEPIVDNAQTIKFIIDGWVSMSRSLDAPIVTMASGSRDVVGIGGKGMPWVGYDYTQLPFNGNIADVRVYNRELTNNEVITLYEGRQILDNELVYNLV